MPSRPLWTSWAWRYAPQAVLCPRFRDGGPAHDPARSHVHGLTWTAGGHCSPRARAQVCENTGTPADGARTHTVLLSGIFLTGAQVLAIVNLRTEGGKNVGMRLSVRSADKQISQFVASCVA